MAQEPPAFFMERHLVASLVIAVLLLVVGGVALGQGVGKLTVHVCQAVLPHMDPST